MNPREIPENDAPACPACGAPVTDDGACPSCAPAAAPRATPAAPAGADAIERSLALPPGAPEYGVAVRLFACEACGTRLAVEAESAAVDEKRADAGGPEPSPVAPRTASGRDPGRCPLCGSASLAPADCAGVGPVTVAPFAVPPARAQAIFHRWLKRLRLRPPEWLALARSRGLRGVFLPLWTVDATLRSRWTAEVAKGPTAVAAGPVPAGGVHRRWEPASGERIDHVAEAWPAIPLDPDSPAQASVHDGGGLVPWAPEYLAGWSAVIPAGGPDDAWRQIREALFERARERCAADVPGDEHRALRVETSVEVADVAAALVPVYVAAIPWRGKVHRFVIDGRTGRAEGLAPYSPGKLAALVGAGVLAVAAMGAILAHEDPPARPAATSPLAK